MCRFYHKLFDILRLSTRTIIEASKFCSRATCYIFENLGTCEIRSLSKTEHLPINSLGVRRLLRNNPGQHNLQMGFQSFVV